MHHRHTGSSAAARPAPAGAANSFVTAASQTGRSVFQRAYSVLALFALINMVGLVGLGTFLIVSGRLDAIGAGQLLAMLRGEPGLPRVPPAPPAARTEDAEAVSSGEPSEV